MSLEFRQSQRLEQRMVMTQNLRMAIEMLQMTRQELRELIETQLLENPVLEQAEPGEAEDAGAAEVEAAARRDASDDGDAAGTAGGDGDGAAGESAAAVERAVEGEIFDTARGELRTEPEMDWDRYFDYLQSGPSEGADLSRPADDGPSTPFEERLARTGALSDHLMWQVESSELGEAEKRAAREIIGNLDDDGFLRDVSLDDIAARTAATAAEVERAHRTLMHFDPLGVGARDLRETLLVQARYHDPAGLEVRLLRDCFDWLPQRAFAKIAKHLKVDMDDVQEAVKRIARLNPRPGAAYSNREAEYIEPDVFITKVGDEYVIGLNDDGVPRLRISKAYESVLRGRDDAARGVRAYVKDKLRGAEWLVRCVQQRRNTIYRVVEAVVRRQREFLDRGRGWLKPMILRDIAEEVELSESTISRVTSNKYALTPHGVIELKAFFSQGIENDRGEAISGDVIQERVRAIVAGEDPAHPFSDEQIVKILEREDVKVARRTVAKYRDIMGILSSAQRRRT